MPTTKFHLTDRKIAALREGRHADGHNLYIHVRGGSRLWVLRYVFGGKRREMQLGRYPELSLADARLEALRWKREHDAGRDPLAERAAQQKTQEAERQRASHTLERQCRDYHANHQATWRNPKHAEQWLASLERHIFPQLGSRPIAAVTADELLRILRPLNAQHHETAKRLRQRLEAVWVEAIIAGVAEYNHPATLVRSLRGPAVKRHFESLDYREVPAFLRQLRDSDAGLAVRTGFEFLILACARTVEVRMAAWNEFDLPHRVWKIPGERMKAGQPHEVPLTGRMLEILEAAKPLSGGEGIVFSGYRNEPLSDGAFLAVLRRMGRHQETTVHGFRASFSTWASETTHFRADIIEAALAHREADAVRAAYNRAQYWEQRVSLAGKWTDYVTAQASSHLAHETTLVDAAAVTR